MLQKQRKLKAPLLFTAAQVGKLQRSKTKGITNARGVLTVNVIRAKGLEVSILLFLLLEKQSDFWQQS